MTSPRKPDPVDPATVGIEQSAKLLRLGVDATRELVITGELPALSCNQKHYVLLRDDVLEYIRTEGRKQAEARRTAHAGTPAPPAPAPAPAPRSHRSKKALPDLGRYELTTGAQPGSSPEGSRNA